MGQKVHPYGLRLGIIKDWESRWYAGKDYSDLLLEDYKVRNFLKEKLYAAGISKIEIDRSGNRLLITVHTAKPGIVIGRGGVGIEETRKAIEAMTKRNVNIKVQEIKIVEADAQLVAENIAAQLEKRIGFRRAMKQSIQRAMRTGAKGIKISCSGRLGGAEIARTEEFHEGTIPLHTLRADIHYGFAEAKTTYGRIGVKVWVYKGQILPTAKQVQVKEGGDK